MALVWEGSIGGWDCVGGIEWRLLVFSNMSDTLALGLIPELESIRILHMSPYELLCCGN